MTELAWHLQDDIRSALKPSGTISIGLIDALVVVYRPVVKKHRVWFMDSELTYNGLD